MRTPYTTIEPTLIVGCGIAGPALAIALRRAGFDSVVYEAEAASRDRSGAFLNLAPNGLEVMRVLNLDNRIEPLGFVNDHLVFQNDSGRVLADVQVGAVTLLRSALSRALREAAVRAGVRFEFGKRLEAVEQRGSGAMARFGDGSVVVSTTLIGADGVHSRTRRRFFPEAPRPKYTGVIHLGGIVHTDLEPTGTAMNMIFGRRAFFGYAVRPDGETYWFSNYTREDEPPRGELDSIRGEDYREKLLALHADDPPEVTGILEQARNEIGAYPVYDIATLPRWQRGPVCLVGDAAHAVGPHVGQGASLALEDAFVLAKCLRDLPNPPAAFATFERERRDRVERIVRHSRRTGEQKSPTNAIGRMIRDWVLPVFLKRDAAAAKWMCSYPVEWDDPIEVDTGFPLPSPRGDDTDDDDPLVRHA